MTPEELEEKLKWIKYRWEFLRRSETYLNNYKKYLLEREYYPSQDNIVGYSEPYDAPVSCSLDPIGKAVNSLVYINLNHPPNPEKTFEELLDVGETLSFETIKKIPKEILDLALNMFELMVIRELKPHPLISTIIGIKIDLRQVNSISSVKKAVNILIEKKYNEYLNRRAMKKSQRYMIDYDIHLKVGDMHDKEGLTFTQIAQKIFPRDYKDDNISANPESAETKVKQYYETYQALVDGDFMFLIN
jgi:hypothetical protein